MISPDPAKEDAEKDLLLNEITVQTMQTLEERLQNHASYVAAEHDDHTPHRYVHVLACVKGKLLTLEDRTKHPSEGLAYWKV